MDDIISMHTAKSTLSQLVKRAAAGEVVYIGAYGRAEAKLVAADADIVAPRRIGILKGKLEIPADFDAPLPDEVLRGFEGSA
jgi:antitoxin (DNA-binding transcriptional repressor) of toxin-antitoxin stability system